MVVGVRMLVVVVGVAPQQQLLHHEENEDAAQDRGRHGMRLAVFEGVRNHLEERRAQQRAEPQQIRFNAMGAHFGWPQPLAIGMHVLGGLASSRLDNVLVRGEQLAVSVTASALQHEQLSFLQATMDVKPGVERAAAEARFEDGHELFGALAELLLEALATKEAR